MSSVMAQKERGCASLTIVFVSKKRDEFNMKKTKRKARHQKCMTGWHKIFGMPLKNLARYLIQGQSLKPVIRKILALRALRHCTLIRL